MGGPRHSKEGAFVPRAEPLAGLLLGGEGGDGRDARLREAAAKHGLSSWLAQLLPEASQGLREDALQAAYRSLRLKRLLGRVLEVLCREGLRPVLLKGLGFSSRFYPAGVQRPCSDVDLLVAPDEVFRATELLKHLGLAPTGDPGLVAGAADSHHASFIGPDGLVELHFRALQGFGRSSLEYATLAPRMLDGTWEGSPVRYLGPDDEFVYMAAHGANHLFSRLSWLLDLELIRHKHPGFDWDRIGALVRTAKLANALTLAWSLGERIFGWEPLPPAAETWSRGAHRGRQVARLLTEARLVSSELGASRIRSFLLRAWLADAPGDITVHVGRGAVRLGRRELHHLRTRLPFLRDT